MSQNNKVSQTNEKISPALKNNFKEILDSFSQKLPTKLFDINKDLFPLNTFEKIFNRMTDFDFTKKLFSDEKILNFWFPRFPENVSEEIKQKILIESKQKFYFAWIFEEKGIEKFSKEWIPFLEKTVLQDVVLMIISKKITIEKAISDKSDWYGNYIEDDKAILEVVNINLAKAIMFIYAKNYNEFLTFFAWTYKRGILFGRHSKKRSIFFEHDLSFLSREIRNDYPDSEKHFIKINQFAFNEFFNKPTFLPKSIYFNFLTQENYFKIWKNLLKLTKNVNRDFELMKLILNQNKLEFNDIILYKKSPLDRPNTSYYDDRIKLDILEFYEMFNIDVSNSCINCKNLVQNAKESHTSIVETYKEHIVALYKKVNNLQNFEPKKVKVENHTFHYLNDPEVLKEAGTKLRNCMARAYVYTLESKEMNDILFAATKKSNGNEKDFRLGIRLLYSDFEQKWILKELLQKMNNKPTEYETKITKEFVDQLNREKWKPIKKTTNTI